MPPLLLLLLAALLAVDPASAAGADAYDGSMCQKSFACGGHDIHYPFYLSNESTVIDGVAHSYCGYPGMAILCDAAAATATLRLAGGTNYTVLAIDYANHTITLADADALKGNDCPRPRHNVTIPREAWLNFTATGNSTISFFLDCDPNLAPGPPPPELLPINCTGFPQGQSPSFLAPQRGAPDGNWSGACAEVYVAPVLSEWLASPEYGPRLGSGGYGEVLRRGFRLSWDPSAGPCYECELSKGQCGYDQTGGFLGCLCPDGRVRGPDCGSKKVNKKAITYGTSAAALVMFLLLLVVSFLYIRKRRQYKMTSSSRLLEYTMSGETPRSRGSTDMESGSVHDLPTHHFSYEELEEATGGFSDTRELGDGGFGTVYKGQLRDGRVVAVKRLYNTGCRHVEQFVNEAAILSRLRHPNLVTLYGCTSSRSRELLLVYEYVPNGTVADHLHGRRSPERALPWQLRLSIAVEAATALAYLHAVEPPVVHRDVKTSNILLDADFHVKVADFGLSRLLPPDGAAAHVSTAPQGTPGYVDPEYHQCYQLTDKSDVYSFGVVLAELISSKPAVDFARGRDEINLAAMAVGRIQTSQVDQLVDIELGYGSDETTRRAMTMVAELAFRCLQQNGEMRPPIREVLDVLKGIQEGGANEGGKDGKKPKDGVHVVPRSPTTVHAPWDSLSTTPSISQ